MLLPDDLIKGQEAVAAHLGLDVDSWRRLMLRGAVPPLSAPGQHRMAGLTVRQLGEVKILRGRGAIRSHLGFSAIEMRYVWRSLLDVGIVRVGGDLLTSAAEVDKWRGSADGARHVAQIAARRAVAGEQAVLDV